MKIDVHRIYVVYIDWPNDRRAQTNDSECLTGWVLGDMPSAIEVHEISLRSQSLCMGAFNFDVNTQTIDGLHGVPCFCHSRGFRIVHVNCVCVRVCFFF